MNESQVFADALKLATPAERSAFLDAVCAGDAKLRAGVEALLQAHASDPSFLEQPVGSLAGTIDLPASGSPSTPLRPEGQERPGALLAGRYKLQEPIDEGGMGTVWLAQQTEPIKRFVAIKLIKAGMDSRQVLARFDAERQALALMDHPNIAKVFDAGTTSDGRPFFVMELVKGVPITKYCDEHHLTPRQRLELFIPVCHAIQHAHQKGVIHRDIKPSNVLVAMYDDRPVPKVIDFGVAKATGQQLTEATLHTGFGAVVGTIEYMSPEQASFNQLDVDTRSDIYSLGILLYELLAGSPPFTKKELEKAGMMEMLRVIREQEPSKPSTKLSSSETLPSLAANRGTEPARLTKLVRGELDWIVMKALEKDRNRRYETANGFAADVQRYLTDESVLACPPSASYRLRKLARRYRVPLTVAAGFLLLLVAGTVISTYQAIRIQAEQQNTLAQKVEADRERNRAERERATAVAAEQKALTEARKSEQVAAFMTDMIKGVGPSVALGRDTVMLREILDNATRRLDKLKGQPAVEANLRTVLGDVSVDLGEYPKAEAMYRATLDLRRELLGNRHAEVARALVDLGEALRCQRRLVEAERLLAEGLAMQRELLGNAHPEVGRTLFRLGLLNMNTGVKGHAEAETQFREVLAIYRQHPGRDIAGALDQLALSLTQQGKFADAESVAKECVAMWRKQTPSGSPGLASALYNLGTLLRKQHKHAEAEPYFRDSLEIRRKQLPPGHNATLWSMKNLAGSLMRRDRGEEAVPLIDEFVPLAEGRPVLQDQIPGLMIYRLRHFQKVKDAAGCRTSAEMWERLNRSDSGFLCDAACYRAVTAAVLRAAEGSPQAVKSAAVEEDLAMAWLHKAVAAGYKNAHHMKQDKDLDALRNREDFKKLIAELEAKQGKEKK